MSSIIASILRCLFFACLFFNWPQTIVGIRNVSQIEFPLQSAEQNGRMVIVDSSGKRVKLACVNWSGGQLEGIAH